MQVKGEAIHIHTHLELIGLFRRLVLQLGYLMIRFKKKNEKEREQMTSDDIENVVDRENKRKGSRSEIYKFLFYNK